MKLLHMHVDNFGVLHDFTYDFDEGLNIILEDNGWGKTTMAAFLKTMLYGFDGGLSKDVTENERKRYQPWQGGTYGGFLDFEAEGVRYRVKRTFGETPRLDSVKITNLDNDSVVRISEDSLGEELFKLDASAFKRSVYINQNGVSEDGSTESIQARLNTLVAQANDATAYEGAVADLTQLIKVYEKADGRGQIDSISRMLGEKQTQRDMMEREIQEQDDARMRLYVIGSELETVSTSLEEQKAAYEQVLSDRRKLEASRKALADVNAELAVLEAKKEEARNALGGSVPAEEAIDRNKQSVLALASLAEEVRSLSLSKADEQAAFQKIADQYNQAIPDISRLEAIRESFGELQGLRTAEAAEAQRARAETVPSGYNTIARAGRVDSTFPESLAGIVNSQGAVSDLLRRKESNRAAIEHESESWKAIQKRYKALTDEIDERTKELESLSVYKPETTAASLQEYQKLINRRQELLREKAATEVLLKKEKAEWEVIKAKYQALKNTTAEKHKILKEKDIYNPTRIRPYIAKLGELQKLEHAVSLKQDELNHKKLTREELDLLRTYSGDLAKSDDVTRMRALYRTIMDQQDEADDLKEQIDEENAIAEDLENHLHALETEEPDVGDEVSEPAKGSGTVLSILGLLAMIAGGVLAMMVQPILGAVAAVGLILLIIGLVMNGKYRRALREYDDYQEALARWADEREKRKAELEGQLDEANSALRSLNDDLSANDQERTANESEVIAWVRRFGKGERMITDESIARIGMVTDRVRRLRLKEKEQADTQKFINDENGYIREVTSKITAVYKDVDGLTPEKAIEQLRAQETAYQVDAAKYNTARAAETAYLEEQECTEEQLVGNVPLERSEIKKKLDELDGDLAKIESDRGPIDKKYDGVSELSIEDAMERLRAKTEEYKVAEGRLHTARQNESRYLLEAGITKDAIVKEDSEKGAALKKMQRETEGKVSMVLTNFNRVLARLGLSCREDGLLEAIRKAENVYREYEQYDTLLKNRAQRETETRAKIAELSEKITKETEILQNNYADKQLPERITLVRNDVTEADSHRKAAVSLIERIAGTENRIKQKEAEVDVFRSMYGKTLASADGSFDGVYQKAEEYRATQNEMAPLLRQRDAFVEEQRHMPDDGGAAEKNLREQVAALENRREELLAEQSQKKELIRQADRSLEHLPDISREIAALYDQKEEAENELNMLKRTILLITKARENLAGRYLGRVEELFNDYMRVWMNNDAMRGILDVDLNVSIEEGDRTHVPEGYSAGYSDMMDFCMRLALIDTLFEHEEPFLILDDPFVNLDEERLAKALELLSAMSATRQIVYFVCHPVRAVSTAVNKEDREEFRTLAKKARESLDARIAALPEQKEEDIVPLKERYHAAEGGARLPFEPQDPGYVITASIFTMNFRLSDAGVHPDRNYELFFIDDNGKVLSDRRILELRNDRLSSSQVRFCLNIQKTTQDPFELLVRESGSGDYEIAARFPFQAYVPVALNN